MVEKLKTLGIEPGKDFDIGKIDPDTAKGLQRAMGAFGKLQEGVKKLKTENGWIVIPKDFANYGTDYETGPASRCSGSAESRPHDVVYPTAFDDGDGKPLAGANRYVLHFDKGQTPPTNATWSVSMYDPQGYYVPNAINRYNLAMWMPLKHNADGSLDLYIQASSPGADKESNWLPAPPAGRSTSRFASTGRRKRCSTVATSCRRSGRRNEMGALRNSYEKTFGGLHCGRLA